mmetsp:Transcript_46174/g.98684  ORF Transcript_46174/g.98684 Transcript_46174/m.98684 type:complete len:262 (-) Transcript_46174:107-892(-)
MAPLPCLCRLKPATARPAPVQLTTDESRLAREAKRQTAPPPLQPLFLRWHLLDIRRAARGLRAATSGAACLSRAATVLILIAALLGLGLGRVLGLGRGPNRGQVLMSLLGLRCGSLQARSGLRAESRCSLVDGRLGLGLSCALSLYHARLNLWSEATLEVAKPLLDRLVELQLCLPQARCLLIRQPLLCLPQPHLESLISIGPRLFQPSRSLFLMHLLGHFESLLTILYCFRSGLLHGLRSLCHSALGPLYGHGPGGHSGH